MYVLGHGIQVGSYFMRGRQEMVEKFDIQTCKSLILIMNFQLDIELVNSLAVIAM